jgi:hypothetical protein
MAEEKGQAAARSAYFELSKHTPLQYMVYILLVVGIAYALFEYAAIPLMEAFFQKFLHAEIANQNGLTLEYRISEHAPKDSIITSFYHQWGIIERTAAELPSGKLREARYLFDPLLSLFPVISAISFGLATFFVAFLPKSIGLLRQKIEREIMNALDSIALSLYGEHTDSEISEIRKRLLNADIREIHDMSKEYHITVDEASALQSALQWQDDGQGLMAFVRTQSALRFYMRRYFTIQYGNAILGLVYIGAAALIIIIGIRGLKFIPSSEPSIILFALGLEFVLLIIYAVTLIYSPKEEGAEHTAISHDNGSMLGLLGNNDAQDNSARAREVESLLRIFITNKPGSRDK